MDNYVEVKDLAPKGDTGQRIKQWEGLTLTESVGTPVKSENYTHLSIQVEGAFGEKGRLVFEGTNDNENFHTLSDRHGAKLAFSKPGLYTVEPSFVAAQPRVADGDDDTKLTVTLVMKP